MLRSAARILTVATAISLIAVSAAEAQRSRRSSQSEDTPAPAAAAPEKAAPAEQAAPAAPPAPAVTFVTLQPQDITLTTLLPGRVVASGVAEVRPQVDGIITERLFDEGADVKIGDPMYRIAPETYEARVAAARAAVAQAQATFNQAENDATRNDRLRQRGVISEQQLETAVATRETADAALQVAQAQLLQAEIDLDRTTITAQLSGVVGRSFATQGSLVTAGQATALAVIRTIDPVYVDVTQSAAELLEFRRGMLQERLKGADTSVALTLADGTVYEKRGELTAAEPYVNESTGVVTLRLTFENPNRLLLPGMYVQVQMPQGQVDNVVLAPQEGVTRNRRGQPIAYIVNGENVIEERELVTAGTRGNAWIITDGLSGGDRIVVAGLQRIRPGVTVRPEERPAAEAEPPVAGSAAPEAPIAPDSAPKGEDAASTDSTKVAPDAAAHDASGASVTAAAVPAEKPAAVSTAAN